MADITSYINYFRSLAEKHKEILHSQNSKHFFMMDINELLSATNSTIRYPALALLKINGKIIDKKEDNRLLSLEGGFLIIDHSKVIDDFTREIAIFNSTFNIGMQIISKIIADQEACLPLAQKAVPDFNPDLVKWEMVGPVFENHFGILFKFPITFLLDLEFNPSKWNES